jgi:hypothetical protein
LSVEGFHFLSLHPPTGGFHVSPGALEFVHLRNQFGTRALADVLAARLTVSSR